MIQNQTQLRKDVQTIKKALEQISLKLEDIEESLSADEDAYYLNLAEEEYSNGETKTLEQVKAELRL